MQDTLHGGNDQLMQLTEFQLKATETGFTSGQCSFTQ